MKSQCHDRCEVMITINALDKVTIYLDGGRHEVLRSITQESNDTFSNALIYTFFYTSFISSYTPPYYVYTFVKWNHIQSDLG